MNDIQYTIRGISTDLDRILRMRAKKRSVSFNSELLRTLQQDVIGHGKATQRKINLDWLYGTGGTSDAEQKTFDAQRVIDLDAWAIK